jgi:uncharacterized phage protein (TIGR02218 family)
VSRTVPAGLQTAFSSGASTKCGLMRIAPADGDPFGFTSTNAAVTYDDGDGEITYAAGTGYDRTILEETSDTAVDNAEATLLLVPGLTYGEAEIIAGKLDGATWTIYEVDYTDLSLGHRVVGHGKLGKPRIGKGAQSVALELRSLVDLLRQEPWQKWQRRCRVRYFGSQDGDERFPCLYDITAEWVDGVAVTAVGVEDNRTFTATALAQADDYFAPGMVEWLTGDNAGQSFEVSEFAASVVTLVFPTAYPVSTGDTFRIRRDCTREWEGHNSCNTYGNRLNYRAEPKMRPADAAATQVPGARVGAGRGGTLQSVVAEIAAEGE